jgi:hypothetical protein
MENVEKLKQEARQGRIDTDRLIDLLATLQQQLHAAHQRIAQLEQQLPPPATPKPDESFSLRAEEQRQQARGKTKRQRTRGRRRGRLSSADKLQLAQRTETVLPKDVSPQDCHYSHTRPVWRLENGRAVLVAYAIYRGPNQRYGVIPGVLGRSEFGLEIVIEVAYLVHVVGLSFDKVCQALQFFQGLALRKSQVDALLHQLARHWEQEFEILCTLLANSLVVHADETRWSLHSVWAFLSEKARVLLFGVPKDAETLQRLLDPATFAGLVISDDAAVYAHFSAAQKCWAHLLRKAIKLTLVEPSNATYRNFADRLLAIYRSACRVQRDGRLSAAGRVRKVDELDDALLKLCLPQWSLEQPPLPEGPANDYRLLVNEVMRLMLAQELFPFVTTPEVVQPNGAAKVVAGTNNEAERTLRGAATARKTGRTNKTVVGARRQTILVSVLESLRLYLGTFTLASVLAEIQGWCARGRSCFRVWLEKLQLALPEQSVLERILPVPDG